MAGSKFYQNSISICSNCNHYPCYCNYKIIKNNQNNNYYDLKTYPIYSEKNNCNSFHCSSSSKIPYYNSSTSKNLKYKCYKKRKNYCKNNCKYSKCKCMCNDTCSKKSCYNKNCNNKCQSITCFVLASLLLFAFLI
ncbi:hypothetical protein [Romboutsia lituseburensis]|uniref:hypothetical protein n=1 Tax=Romboutsia lituseburensis TaxID=1537 RepID=UPI00215AEC11|nr:hypothetical protein [Romboutsia lituseburensis]MCR8744912.1 hypothetical protein [Romboutsia lituseburensis]